MTTLYLIEETVNNDLMCAFFKSKSKFNMAIFEYFFVSIFKLFKIEFYLPVYNFMNSNFKIIRDT